MNTASNGDDNEASLKKHYGKQAVRKSFAHFAIGKGVKFVATLSALLILARWMETSEYGAYIALRGFTEVARVVTTIGISAVMFRYLPELRAAGNSVAAYRLLRHGMLLRIVAIVAIYIAVMPFMDELGITFNIADWIWLIPIALAIGSLEFVVTTLSQSLESFMWQKEAQFSLAAGQMSKVLLFVALVVYGELNIVNVIYAEGAGFTISLLLLTFGLWRKWRADEDRALGETSWLKQNLRRMVRFGSWAFALNLSRALYGPGPNRLLVANQMPIGDLATFGFASNLAQFGRRMMPSKLTATMLRPLLVAKFAVSSDFARVSYLSNLIYRFNLSILVIPTGALLVAGEYFLDLATGGKYGAAAPLLAAFMVILVVEGMRQLLELAAGAVERNDLMGVTNLVQSLSLFLAIPFIPQIGAWAVLVANFIGTLIANVILIKLLARVGYRFTVTWPPILRVVLYALVAGAAGWAAANAGLSAFVGSTLGLVVFVVVYAALYWVSPPFDADERQLIKSYKGRRRGKNKATGPEAD